MTHEDSSKPEVDPVDAAEALDDESTTEGESAAVSLTKKDSDDASAPAEDDAAPAEPESDSAEDTSDAVDDTADDAEESASADSADDEVDAFSDDGDEGADAGDTVPDDGDEPSHRKPLASLALAAAIAALIAAVVCVGYFGYVGVRAYTVDSERVQMRDDAVDAAGQAIINTLSIDPAKLDQWEKQVKSSLTGDALTQATDPGSKKVLDQAREAAAQGKSASLKVRIIRAVPTQVNVDDHTVEVLVLAAATSSAAPSQPQPQSNLLTMVEVDGVWKASKIVPLTEIQYAEGASPVSSLPGGQSETDQQGGN